MSSNHVFISRASKDDEFVKDLREALEGLSIPVWVDSRKLRGGARLAPEINDAIEQARQVIVVISPNTVNSPWVRREISKALEVEKQRRDQGYRVIPLLLPGIEPSALPLWFEEEPVGIRVEIRLGGLNEAMPAILTALGEWTPDDPQPVQQPAARPVAELKLHLKNPRLEQVAEGKHRVTAMAHLTFDPADASSAAADSRQFKFTAPLGPIEGADLRWYLESYYVWPTSFFTERALRIESQLPQWGNDLYQAATAAPSAQLLLADWKQAAEGIDRRVSIFVDSRAPEGSSKQEEAACRKPQAHCFRCRGSCYTTDRPICFRARTRCAYAAVWRKSARSPRPRPRCLFASCWSARAPRTSEPLTSIIASAPGRCSRQSNSLGNSSS